MKRTIINKEYFDKYIKWKVVASDDGNHMYMILGMDYETGDFMTREVANVRGGKLFYPAN